MTWKIARALLLLLLIAPSATAAPPTVNYFLPAGAQRGQSLTVKAAGSFSSWPPSIWIDRAGVTVEAAEEKGSLQFTVAADATPGLYLIRLYNNEGASELRPFVVGTLPEQTEQEPNDTLAKATAVTSSAVINGQLGRRDDVDSVSLELTAGQTLVASLQARQVLGSPMDGVLQLCDSRGFVLAQNDDERGTDPLIVFTAAQPGKYVVRCFAFPETPNSTIALAGSDNYVYRLTVTTDGFLDYSMPLSIQQAHSPPMRLFGWNIGTEIQQISPAVNDQQQTVAVFNPALAESLLLPVHDYPALVEGPATEELLQPPFCITGRIDSSGQEDSFRFQAPADKALSFRVESRSLGFPLDPWLTLRKQDGAMTKETDDVSGNPDSRITHKFSTAGPKTVSVRDAHRHGGNRYVYRLTVQPVEPSFALTLTTDRHTMAAGKEVDIEVAIERKDGFADELTIIATDLPPGVSCAEVKSPAKGAEAKKVKLRLVAAADATGGPFRIVGHCDSRHSTARFPHRSRDNLTNCWLSVTPPPGNPSQTPN